MDCTHHRLEGGHLSGGVWVWREKEGKNKISCPAGGGKKVKELKAHERKMSLFLLLPICRISSLCGIGAVVGWVGLVGRSLGRCVGLIVMGLVPRAINNR